MKPNLVLFEMVPEESFFISVPQSELSTEQLDKIHGKYLNTVGLTDEETEILDAINDLGIIKVTGPVDAADFNRIYTCGFIL